MEKRIEINGVWYVREDAINDSLDILDEEEMDLTWTEECIYENDDYCFVASRIRRGEGEEFYPYIDIKFTDKRHSDRTEWTTEHWDNISWFRGVLENNPESLEHLREALCDKGVKQFKMFLRKLVEVKWLKMD
jgi:hypothetical protein